MFGFLKKKKKFGFDCDKFSETLDLLSMAIGISALGHDKPDFSKINRECLKGAMIDDLRRLRADHWDKDAFDRLIEDVKRL